LDLSPGIAVIVPLAGLGLALVLGRRRAARGDKPGVFAALAIAFGLGFALMFMQVLLHGVCVESLKLCTNRGDVNMSYWFQSFFAFPLYWVTLLIAGRSKH
jgi:hypothetical protein